MDKDHIVDANKRVSKNPVGAPRQMIGGNRRNIYIDQASWQKAKELGNGKPSEGIRIALRNMKITVDM